MSFFEKFLDYSKRELWEIDSEEVFGHADSMEREEKVISALALYKIDLAKDYVSHHLEDEIEIESIVVMDQVENKDNKVFYLSKHVIGGHNYEIIIDVDTFPYGKVADTPEEFHNDVIASIRSLVKHPYHIDNHIDEHLDEKAYNPGLEIRAEANKLDSYLKGENHEP